MARNRKRKSRKGMFTEDQMKQAIQLVKEQGYSCRRAAAELDLSYVTISRYIKKQDANPDAVLRPRYDNRIIFTKDQEKALEEYLVVSSKMFYGLTPKDCRKLAFEMAIKNRIAVPDSWRVNQSAGEEWYKYFRIRHPRLSCRKPEACSLSRATSFNKHNVAAFYDKLEEILQRHEGFRDGTRIYNLDETATSTVQTTKKVLGVKGSRQISQCTSGERGVLVTTCAIICASGFAIPPAMIFPRVKFKPVMTKDAPPGTLGLAAQSGWMNKELFIQVMKHFINATQSSIENPSCLIMDNHESHLSIETLDLAKKNGVTILTLPPHCSHRLQPLDVSIFGPLKAHYNSAVQAWLLNHPGIPLSLYDIGYCVKIAHDRSMTPTNIRSGFQKTGIFPFDRNIFSDEDFLCLAVTDRPQNTIPPKENDEADGDVSEQNASTSNTNIVMPEQDADSDDIDVILPKVIEVSANNSLDISQSSSGSQNLNENKQKAAFLSPQEFRGFPKAKERKMGRLRKKGKSMIATDTPEKEELERKASEIYQKKKAAAKRKVLDSSDNSPKNKKKAKVVKHTKKRTSSSSDMSEDERLNSQDFNNAISSSDDDDWVPEPQFSGFEELSRRPDKGDYVLVEFRETARKKLVYYVAKILEVLQDDEFRVTYLRKGEKMRDKFITPQTEKTYEVGIGDIKLLLPQPENFGATKRQQSHLSFEINFGTLDVR